MAPWPMTMEPRYSVGPGSEAPVPFFAPGGLGFPLRASRAFAAPGPCHRFGARQNLGGQQRHQLQHAPGQRADMSYGQYSWLIYNH